MERTAGEKPSINLEEARDYVGRAIELLISEDIFGAVLQLQKARSILNEYPTSPIKEAPDQKHDWAIIDPYTAQCKLCGIKRSLGIEERTISPMSP